MPDATELWIGDHEVDAEHPLPVTGAGAGGSVPTSSPIAATATLTNVNDSASSQSLLAANAARKAAYFSNDPASDLFLKFGATASATSFTVKIAPGGFYEMPTSPVFTGAIDGIWSADASGAVRITELS